MTMMLFFTLCGPSVLFIFFFFFSFKQTNVSLLKVEAEKPIQRIPHSCSLALQSSKALQHSRCELKSLLQSGVTSQQPISLQGKRSSKILVFYFKQKGEQGSCAVEVLWVRVLKDI